MRATRLFWPCLISVCAATAGAAPAVAVPATAASAATSAPAAASRTTVIEDKNVRIEETRIRGQLQRITVQSKLRGAKPYEIIVGPGGRDPSQDHGAEGQRAWSVFDF